ncbi:MAG TPA: hypothetical protein V6D47_04080 [Oscillatoriaceae cyanobacterium]
MSNAGTPYTATDYAFGCLLFPWIFFGGFAIVIWGFIALPPFFLDSDTVGVLKNAPAAHVFEGIAQVAPDAPRLTVPSTGRPAIAIDFDVKQVEVTGSGKKIFYPLFHDRRGVPFSLKTKRATYEVESGYTDYVGFGTSQPLGELRALGDPVQADALPSWALHWHGQEAHGQPGIDYRLSTSALLPGDTVTVVAQPRTVKGKLSLGPSPSGFVVLVGSFAALTAAHAEQVHTAEVWFFGFTIWLSPFILRRLLGAAWAK